MQTVQPPMAGLVANPMATAVLERFLQHSEILKNRKEDYRKEWKLWATKYFFTPSFIASYTVHPERSDGAAGLHPEDGGSNTTVAVTAVTPVTLASILLGIQGKS